jgi:hypothetical protein
MRTVGAVVGAITLIVVLFAGWWAIDRVQEHLPGPVNALIDGVQYGGLPNQGPLIAPLVTGQSNPLDACPAFADDVRAAGEAVGASRTMSDEQVRANNELLLAEMNRLSGGGAPRPLAASGVAAALSDQSDGLEALAAAMRRTEFQTQQAASLAVGIAAASERVARANRAFVAQAEGTPAQWQEWVSAVTGPMQQVEVAVGAMARCPE